MSVPYKGCLIDPRAYELADGSGWGAEVYVAEDDGGDTVDTRFVLRGVYPSKEAALEAALETGKREVDRAQDSWDIRAILEDETRLPSTYRRGYGSDDIASGTDGLPTKVDRPENPEDLYR